MSGKLSDEDIQAMTTVFVKKKIKVLTREDGKIIEKEITYIDSEEVKSDKIKWTYKTGIMEL